MPPGGTRGNRGGRPRKATALHVLDGTFRKHRHEKRRDTELQPTADGRLPPPPSHLSTEVRDAWTQVADTLTFKIFTKDDVVAFQSFAATWAEWNRMQKHVEKHGVACESETKDGRITRSISPEARMWSDLTGKLFNFFGRFGMTPADRSRIDKIPGAAHVAKKENPDDEFNSKDETA